MTFSLPTYLDRQAAIVNQALVQSIGEPGPGNDLIYKAVRYSVDAGGKRVRPILTLATAEALGAPVARVLPLACALEMIHTYSLIHDDLPAMDDDDLRRGKPTNHKVFGEATAILAGDALLTKAFEVMCLAEGMTLDLVREVAKASGMDGMVGGQLMDLEAERREVGLTDLERIHSHKTGALLRVSVTAAARLSGADAAQLENFGRYGRAIGLAFQIADDVLDIGGGEEIGKDVGSDVDNQKATYPKLMGIAASKAKAKELVDEAIAALAPFGDRAVALREIAAFIVNRRK